MFKVILKKGNHKFSNQWIYITLSMGMHLVILIIFFKISLKITEYPSKKTIRIEYFHLVEPYPSLFTETTLESKPETTSKPNLIEKSTDKKKLSNKLKTNKNTNFYNAISKQEKIRQNAEPIKEEKVLTPKEEEVLTSKDMATIGDKNPQRKLSNLENEGLSNLENGKLNGFFSQKSNELLSENKPLPSNSLFSLPKRISGEPPSYTEEARKAGIEGIVEIKVLINEEGEIKNIQILKSIPILDEVVIKAVKKWRFKPAFKDGKPLSWYHVLRFTFKLQ